MRPSRPEIRGAIVIAGAAATLILTGCTAQQTAASAPSTGVDQAFAKHSIDAEQATLRRTVARRWTVGRPFEDPEQACPFAALREEQTGHAAASDYLAGRQVRFGLSTYVFANPTAALHVLSARSANNRAQCVIHAFARLLERQGYTPSAPAQLANYGGEHGQAFHIAIPSRYRGRPVTWNLDADMVYRFRQVYGLEMIYTGRSGIESDQNLTALLAGYVQTTPCRQRRAGCRRT